mgnify:CR=1 FL=1
MPIGRLIFATGKPGSAEHLCGADDLAHEHARWKGMQSAISHAWRDPSLHRCSERSVGRPLLVSDVSEPFRAGLLEEKAREAALFDNPTQMCPDKQSDTLSCSRMLRYALRHSIVVGSQCIQEESGCERLLGGKKVEEAAV